MRADETLLRLLRASGAGPAEMEEIAESIRKWSRGSSFIDVHETARKHTVGATMSEEPDNNFATAEENLVALQEWLAEIDQKAPRSIDKWFATSVLKATHRAYGHLRSGRLTDTSYTSWEPPCQLWERIRKTRA